MADGSATEPSAVAPDHKVYFDNHSLQSASIFELTVASGASTTPARLPRRGPRTALGSVFNCLYQTLRQHELSDVGSTVVEARE